MVSPCGMRQSDISLPRLYGVACTSCGRGVITFRSSFDEHGMDKRTGEPFLCGSCNFRENRSSRSYAHRRRELAENLCIYWYFRHPLIMCCEKSAYTTDSKRKPRPLELIPGGACLHERYSCSKYRPSGKSYDACEMYPKGWYGRAR